MAEDVNRKFLRLLGWEGEDLEAFLPDWMTAARFLGLTKTNISYAVSKWIPTYWDLSLKGIRMLISACIKEVAELAKSQQYLDAGDAVMYVNIPSAPVCIYANKLAGGEKLHISYPGYMLVTVLGALFNKNSEECYGSTLNNHCAHCKMNRIRANATVSGVLPHPTITWNWGIKCSEAPKTEELLACMEGENQKNAFITIPHDALLGDIEANNSERVDYLAAQLRKAQGEVSAATGIQVTEEHMRQALDEYMRYMELIEQLTDLVLKADPQPISCNELNLFGLCTDMCFEQGYPIVIEALETVIDEVKERVAQGKGVLAKHAPRVFCQFNPLYAPWIEKAFRDNGVCLSQGRVFPFAHTFREYMNDSDVYRTVARMSLATPSAMNMKDEARINIELLNRYHFDGALYGFYSFDKWVGALQKTMVRLIEDKTGVPHFYLEGDLWDSKVGSDEDRRAIIRSICNCLKISNV